jgi:hypothetical protein
MVQHLPRVRKSRAPFVSTLRGHGAVEPAENKDSREPAFDQDRTAARFKLFPVLLSQFALGAPGKEFGQIKKCPNASAVNKSWNCLKRCGR